MNPIHFFFQEPRLLRSFYVLAYLGVLYITIHSTTSSDLPFISSIGALSSLIWSIFFLRISQSSLREFSKMES
ncbi:MAG: hypothetical protein ACPGRE_10035 [Flavobacteriaceae bacterium]